MSRAQWILAVVAVVVSVSLAIAAKTASGRWAWAVAGLVAAIAVILPVVKDRIERSGKSREVLRGLAAGAASSDPFIRDVSTADLHVRAAVRDDIGYVQRDQQGSIVNTLGLARKVLIVGPAMAGKTRLMLAAVKKAYPDWRLHQPADGRSLHTQIAAGVRFHQVVVWLDDLERAIGSGLTDHDLRTLHDRGLDGESPGVVVVASMRTTEWEKFRPTGDQLLAGFDTISWFGDPVELRSLWSDAELDRLTATSAGATVEEQARTYGLGCYLGGANLLTEKLRIGASTHPEGYGVVRACVDWRRAGMQRKLTVSEVCRLLGAYVPTSQVVSIEDQTKTGLSWAISKINDTVALVTDRGGLQAEDLLLDQFDDESVPEIVYDAIFDWGSDDELADAGRLARNRGNIDAARRLTLKAAENGHTPAMAHLGYLLSVHVDPPDLDGACRWYERAALEGSTTAMFNLGFVLSGRLDPPDLVGACRWYERAARNDHRKAMVNLGFLLSNRLDPPDLVGACRWYERAAEAGSTRAMFNLGFLLSKRVDPPDLDGARRWYERAAEAGSTKAMSNLGSLLSKRVDPPDLDGARAWYEKAAEAGSTIAMVHLGNLLSKRVDPPDLDGARRWYDKAAEAADRDA